MLGMGARVEISGGVRRGDPGGSPEPCGLRKMFDSGEPPARPYNDLWRQSRQGTVTDSTRLIDPMDY